MPAPTSFQFASRAFPPEAFQVVSFNGEEELSRPYEFNINLATKEPYIDLNRLLDHPATFVIRQGGRRFPYHGIVINIDQVNRVNEYTFYQAVLVPRLYRLSMIHRNQVFLDKTIPEILGAVLEEGGLTTDDYEFRLQGDETLYRTWEMVCQYNQSHLDFFSFWTENMGLYYYFEQDPVHEKLIVTDTHLAHQPFIPHPHEEHDSTDAPTPPPPPPRRPREDEGKMIYAPPSGLGGRHYRETIFAFRRRQRKVARSIRMKDYYYEKPSLDLSVQAGVTPRGVGQVDIHGDMVHYRSQEEGEKLARIRAEELRCRETIHTGLSHNAGMRSGFAFHLTRHYQEDFNRKYMTVKVGHSGNQAGYLTAGLKKIVEEESGKPLHLLTMTLKKILFPKKQTAAYENRFIAIPAEVQFRPERTTQPSRIWGTISAVVDGAKDGKYAELDEQGRYKVILPFDSSGRKGLKASTWVRMAQSTGGGKQGMHFPLRPGTEVLLNFLSGDPNRPVIVGAVPNTQNSNIVNSNNSTRAALQSAAGNQLVMDDSEGKEFIALSNANGSSLISLNSTGGSEGDGSGNSYAYTSGNDYKTTMGSSSMVVAGDKNDIFVGAKNSLTAAVATDVFVGAKLACEAGLASKFSLVGSSDFHLAAKYSAGYSAIRNIGKSYDARGYKSAKLAGGMETVTKTTYYTTVAATLGALAAAAGTAVASASTAGLSIALGDGGFTTGDIGTQVLEGFSIAGDVIGGVGLVAGETAMIAAVTVAEAAKYTSELELTKAGMDVKVKPRSLEAGAVCIDMTAEDYAGTEKSLLEIYSNAVGISCENTTEQKSTAVETTADTIELKVERADYTQNTVFKMETDKFSFKHSNFEITISNDSVEVKDGMGQKYVTINNGTGQVLLESGGASVEVKNGVLNLKGDTIKFNNRKLKIDAAGQIEIAL